MGKLGVNILKKHSTRKNKKLKYHYVYKSILFLVIVLHKMIGNGRSGMSPAVLCYLSMLLPLPIIEIVYGASHRSDHGCSSFVGVSDWLIIDGAAMVFIVFLGLILFGCTNGALVYDSPACAVGAVVSFIFFVLCNVFKFAWLIIGSVMFWRDCKDVSPKSVNDLMWASLIIGYVGVWIAHKSSMSKDSRAKN